MRPPQPPSIVERKARMVRTFIFKVGEIWYNNTVGAIFCQVRRIMPDESEIPCVTSGTQKWKGARPSFMASARVIRIEAVELEIWKRVH